MGRNSRLKWERRLARWEIRNKRNAAIQKFETVDTDGMTPEQLHKHFTDTMDDPVGCDYLVGKAIKEQNQGMLQLISNYKQTGYLPPVAFTQKEQPHNES